MGWISAVRGYYLCMALYLGFLPCMGIVHAWPFTWNDFCQLSCIISAVSSFITGIVQVAYRNEQVATRASISVVFAPTLFHTDTTNGNSYLFMLYCQLDTQPLWDLWITVFICSKWPVKTNKPISIHTHMCNDVTLVLISLRFALIISTSCTRAYSHPFAHWQYRWLWLLWYLNEGKLLEDMVVLEQLKTSHVTAFCVCCPHFLVTQCS